MDKKSLSDFLKSDKKKVKADIITVLAVGIVLILSLIHI